MTPQQFSQKIKEQEHRLKQYIERDAPRMAGIEAVNHFKKSFIDGGFTDSSLVKWKPAKRTVSNSYWYGFEYGSRVATPDNHPRRWKAKGKYKPRKANPVTNYSPAATTRKTMSGKTGDLKDSIQYRTEKGRAIIFSDQPYADIHNSGGQTKVFGRKTTTMPKRQFIGDSIKLKAKIKHEIKKDFKRILT